MLILNNFLQERWLWQKSGCGENLIRGLLHFLSVSHPENCFHFFLSTFSHPENSCKISRKYAFSHSECSCQILPCLIHHISIWFVLWKLPPFCPLVLTIAHRTCFSLCWWKCAQHFLNFNPLFLSCGISYHKQLILKLVLENVLVFTMTKFNANSIGNWILKNR